MSTGDTVTRKLVGSAKRVHTGAMGNNAPELAGPVGLSLAAVEHLPGPHGMPGGSRYGLKWDGSFAEPAKSAVARGDGQDSERVVG